jgi:prephenate dehydrogenase
MNLPFSKILIYGVGLMGSSLAISLRTLDPNLKLYGIVRSLKSKESLISKNIFDQVVLEEEFLKNPFWNEVDLIIFGTPVDKIAEQIHFIPKNIKAIITDMGSTKQNIAEQVIVAFGDNHKYISSHPLCGSELTGHENAIPNLYKNKLCILTPIKGSDNLSLVKIQKFWESIGMSCYQMDAENHDRVLAYLSHTPHILSSMMVIWADKHISKENSQSPMPIMGGGFRDMARIAGSNPEMWKAIIQENRNSILNSLNEFRDELNSVIEMMNEGNNEVWKNYFEIASIKKRSLLR